MLAAQAWQSGKFVLRRADGSTSPITVDRLLLLPPMELAGPWNVHFAPGGDAPEKVVFDKLIHGNTTMLL